MTDSATFRATFPPIQSAIKIYGDETGMRIQLEIPESDMAQAVKLLAMRGKVLLVTVTIGNDENKQRAAGSGGDVGDRRLSLRRDK